MCLTLDKYFWETNNITNRISQCNYISERTLKILRYTGLILMAQIIIFSYVYQEELRSRSHLFFTIWGALLMLVLYTFFVLSYAFPDNAFIWKSTHVLFVTAISYGICITLVFWLIIIPAIFVLGLQDEVTAADVIINLEIHGLNYAWALIDFYYNRIELAWNHLIYVLAFGAIYLLFNGLYTTLAQDPVYPGVDWEGWFTAMFILVAAICAFGAFAAFVKISNKKKARYCNTDKNINATPQAEKV